MTSSFRSEPLAARKFVANPLPRSAQGFCKGHAEAGVGESGVPEETARDTDELLRESYELGREAGRAELPWREAEALRSAQAALEQAVRALEDERFATLRAQRETVIELALAVARRILEREVAARLDDIEPVLERALPLLAEAGPVVLHLAPGDLETLRAGGAPALERLAGRALAGIEADEDLRPGDARLSAGSSSVDARIDTILERFRAEMLGMVNLEEKAE
jgi:flagellar assembly protein FliH